MWAAIEWFFRAIAAYLYLQVIKYPDSKQDELEELRERMEKLRNSVNADDHLLADKLRMRILRKEGILAKAVSAADIAAPSRKTNPDGSGGIHPAGG